MPPKTPTHRIVDRHMARLLTNLENAGCPRVWRNGVRAGLRYLRADLMALEAERQQAETKRSLDDVRAWATRADTASAPGDSLPPRKNNHGH